MRQLLTRLFAFALVAIISLTGCSAGTSGQMTGNYQQDTLTVVEGLRSAIQMDEDDPAKPQAESQARALINDFAARYRRDDSVKGLSSFTTMQTALNEIAGHYSSYPNRPIPQRLRDRVEQQLRRVEAALKRGR